MSRQRAWVCGAVVLLALLGAGPGWSGDAPAAGKPAEATFTGKAIAVHLKGQPSAISLLEEPQIRTVGDCTFLIGRVAQGHQRMWLPLADVARIEEFADVEALGKHYRLGQPPQK